MNHQFQIFFLRNFSSNFNCLTTAQILDISVRTIQYRLHEYGVAGQRAKSASSATAGPSRNGVHRAGDGWDRQPTR